jgi:hypothetical protein
VKIKNPNPVWLVPVMAGLLILGVLWIVCFYLTAQMESGPFPIPPIGYWNLTIGFALLMAGFVLSCFWK